jgi:hypothetical protein
MVHQTVEAAQPTSADGFHKNGKMQTSRLVIQEFLTINPARHSGTVVDER